MVELFFCGPRWARRPPRFARPVSLTTAATSPSPAGGGDRPPAARKGGGGDIRACTVGLSHLCPKPSDPKHVQATYHGDLLLRHTDRNPGVREGRTWAFCDVPRLHAALRLALDAADEASRGVLAAALARSAGGLITGGPTGQTVASPTAEGSSHSEAARPDPGLACSTVGPAVDRARPCGTGRWGPPQQVRSSKGFNHWGAKQALAACPWLFVTLDLCLYHDAYHDASLDLYHICGYTQVLVYESHFAHVLPFACIMCVIMNGECNTCVVPNCALAG